MIKAHNIALAVNQWYRYKGSECRVAAITVNNAVIVVVHGPPIGSGEFLVPKRDLTNDCLVRYQGLPGYELEDGYEYREFDFGADTTGWDYLLHTPQRWHTSTGQAPKAVYLYRRELAAAVHAPDTATPITAEASVSTWHHIKCVGCTKWWAMEDLRETTVLYCPHCSKQNKVTVGPREDQ